MASQVLVGLQLLALVGLVWPQPTAGSRCGWLLIGAAVVVGGWAAWLHRHHGLTPLAEPRASLITHGPYRLVRHPMYTSLLLFALGMVSWRWQWFTAASGLMLFVVLLAKMRLEEQLLLRRFAAYRYYRQRVGGLWPRWWRQRR